MTASAAKKIDNPFEYPAMPDHRRRMMLKIIAGEDTRLHEITFPLSFIDEHMPEARRDAGLEWLCRNNIIGRQFILFFRFECKNSNLEFMRVLTAKIEKERTQRALMFGKDFKA